MTEQVSSVTSTPQAVSPSCSSSLSAANEALVAGAAPQAALTEAMPVTESAANTAIADLLPSAPAYVPDAEPLRNLIVNYLPPLMNESQMYQLFAQFGPIESVKIIYDKVTHESRGYGFLKFTHFFSATYAIACLNRFQIGGKKLKVAYANIEGAKQEFDLMRTHATGFTPQQKMAYAVMHQIQTSPASR